MDTCYICGHTQINCSCSSDFSISANESSEDESSEWESDVKKCSNSDIESDSDLTEEWSKLLIQADEYLMRSQYHTKNITFWLKNSSSMWSETVSMDVFLDRYHEQNVYMPLNDYHKMNLIASLGDANKVVKPYLKQKDGHMKLLVTYKNKAILTDFYWILKQSPNDGGVTVVDNGASPLKKQKFFVCASLLSPLEIAELKDNLKVIDGELLNSFDDTCTHLVMTSISQTTKFYLALICGVPIVTPEFFATLCTKRAVPNVADYVPKIDEPIIAKKPSMLDVHADRRRLFDGKTFVFKEKQNMDKFDTIIAKAGGKCVAVDIEKFEQSFCAKAECIPVECSSSISEIAEELELNGRRSIYQWEIGLSILICSIDTYCNPDRNLPKRPEKIEQKAKPKRTFVQKLLDGFVAITSAKTPSSTLKRNRSVTNSMPKAKRQQRKSTEPLNPTIQQNTKLLNKIDDPAPATSATAAATSTTSTHSIGKYVWKVKIPKPSHDDDVDVDMTDEVLNKIDDHAPATPPAPSDKVKAITTKKMFVPSNGGSFIEMLKSNDLIEVDNEAKGNCLFEAVSQCLFGTNNKHQIVRNDAVTYMETNKEDFESFIADANNNRNDESFENYVSRMRQDREWGDMVELQAISNCYSVDIAIYYDNSPIANVTITPINGVHTDQLIRLHYVNGVHYTAIVPKNDASTHTVTSNGPKKLGASDKDSDEKGDNDDNDHIDDDDDDASWMHADAISDCLTPDKLQAYYKAHLRSLQMKFYISTIKNNYIDDEKNTATRVQYENGLKIHKMLTKHFVDVVKSTTQNGRTHGFYGIFANGNSPELKDLLYDGSYKRKTFVLSKSLERVEEHSNKIAKAFSTQDFSFMDSNKKQRTMYMKLFEKIIENDLPIHFITIKDLPYPGTVIESCVKITQLITERKMFPQMVNIAIDTDADSSELRHIFKSNADIVDFAFFAMHNLLSNVQQTFIHTRADMTASVAKLTDLPGKKILCLVKNCNVVLATYNSFFGHMVKTKDKDHVKIVNALNLSRTDKKFYPTPKGLSIFDGLFEIVDEQKVPENRVIRYGGKSGINVKKQTVKCNHCKVWTGTYATFSKSHIKTQHPQAAKKAKGVLCKYEFECTWLTDFNVTISTRQFSSKSKRFFFIRPGQQYKLSNLKSKIFLHSFHVDVYIYDDKI